MYYKNKYEKYKNRYIENKLGGAGAIPNYGSGNEWINDECSVNHNGHRMVKDAIRDQYGWPSLTEVTKDVELSQHPTICNTLNRGSLHPTINNAAGEKTYDTPCRKIYDDWSANNNPDENVKERLIVNMNDLVEKYKTCRDNRRNFIKKCSKHPTNINQLQVSENKRKKFKESYKGHNDEIVRIGGWIKVCNGYTGAINKRHKKMVIDKAVTRTSKRLIDKQKKEDDERKVKSTKENKKKTADSKKEAKKNKADMEKKANDKRKADAANVKEELGFAG